MIKMNEVIKDLFSQEIYDSMRKDIAELAKKGAKIKNLGRMCNTCAFKYDSDANLEPQNVAAAWECVAYNGNFNCHTEIGIDKGCQCVGFLHAKQYFDSVE